MSPFSPSTSCLQLAGRSNQDTSSRDSECWRYALCSCNGSPAHHPVSSRPRNTFIHILDDDSLLNIFHLCRLVLVDEDERDDGRILQGDEWIRERWWCKLVQVCRRWRYLVLAYASHLDLCLICTYNTPIADMLAYSPPLPLIIDHLNKNRAIDTGDEVEEGLLLALQHRDRVRRIHLLMPVPRLQKLITAMGDEFPILEYLYIASSTRHNIGLTLPETFRALHLCHLISGESIFPLEPPLLTTSVGLVTLSLAFILSIGDFDSARDLITQLSIIPQLEVLRIGFHFPVAQDIEVRLSNTPIATRVTLPNLRWLSFSGLSTSLEGFLSWLITPRLENLSTFFSNQLIFSDLNLPQFLYTTERLRFGSTSLAFREPLK
jgi:hypothetical protein